MFDIEMLKAVSNVTTKVFLTFSGVLSWDKWTKRLS
jgi:hypothetical protein